MATSGIFAYQLTRDQLVGASLRKLGVLAEGVSPSSDAVTDAAQALNTVIAALRGVGMPMWSIVEYTWTPTTGTYTIGTGYTLDTPYPIKLLQATRTDSTTNEIPMDIVPFYNFNELPTSTGGPIQINYKPSINYGTIRLWPAPNNTNTATITITYQRPFEYFTSATQTMGFPEEWYLAIIYKLAVVLAPEYGIPLPDRQLLRGEAKDFLQEALDSGQEDGSLFVYPETD